MRESNHSSLSGWTDLNWQQPRKSWRDDNGVCRREASGRRKPRAKRLSPFTKCADSFAKSYQIYNAGIASYLAVEQPIGTTYYGQVGGYVGLYQYNLVVPHMPTGTY